MRRDIFAGCVGLGITAIIVILSQRPTPYKRIEYSPFLHKPELPIVTQPIRVYKVSGSIHGDISVKSTQSTYTIPEANTLHNLSIDELMQLPLENGGELYNYTEGEKIRPSKIFVKYIRFQCTKIRDSTTVEVGGFRFLYGNIPLPYEKMHMWNHHTGDSERYVGGVWSDSDQRSIIFYFQEPVEVDTYEIKSSMKSVSCDPIHWKIEGSMNGGFWTMLDDRTTTGTAFSLERGVVNRYIMTGC
jgi:hypothetical protein